MAQPKLIRATGRRKSSITQALLRRDKNAAPSLQIRHRERPLKEAVSLVDFFPSPILVQLVEKPLVLTKSMDKFQIMLKVHGGGFAGQAGASSLALARALAKMNVENHRILREHGLLTRDARVKERRKPGLKKARKAPQFSKR